MKEKYTSNKKRIKSFLSIGTTLLLIAFFSFVAGKKYLILGLVSLVLGLLFIALTYFCVNLNKKLIKEMMHKCPLCNNDLIIETKVNYYINGKLVEEDDYNNSVILNLQMEKIIFDFYKCPDCLFCLTSISTYIEKDKKSVLKSVKYNVDFNYTGLY